MEPSMSQKPAKQQQIKIELPGDLQPTYANFAIINHSYNEVILDFAHVMANIPKTRVQTRIVMTPYHAKLLLNALGTNIANYEKRFGEIKVKGAGIPDRSFMGVEPSQLQ